MKNIKTYEEFSGLSFKERLDRFSNGAKNIIENYELPEIKVETTEINSIGDVYRFIKSAPKEIVSWCKKIYNENKEEIDKLTLEFKGVNEEICILTLLSIGLLAVSVWLMWPQVKQRLGLGKQKYRNPWTLRKAKEEISKNPRQKIQSYSNMPKYQLQKELDDAIDRGDKAKMKEISKYI